MATYPSISSVLLDPDRAITRIEDDLTVFGASLIAREHGNPHAFQEFYYCYKVPFADPASGILKKTGAPEYLRRKTFGAQARAPDLFRHQFHRIFRIFRRKGRVPPPDRGNAGKLDMVHPADPFSF